MISKSDKSVDLQGIGLVERLSLAQPHVRKKMNKPIIMLVFVALARAAFATIIPSNASLSAESDVTAVIVVESIKDSTEIIPKSSNWNDPKYYQGHLAKCRIDLLIKGPKDLKTLELLYFNQNASRFFQSPN